MSVFARPSLWPMTDLLDWIMDDDEKSSMVDVADLGIEPHKADSVPEELRGDPQIQAAMENQDAMRLYAVWCNDFHSQVEAIRSPGDEFDVLAVYARSYNDELRLCVTEAASEEQVAEALALLAEVLDQKVRKATAEFIIEALLKAELSFFALNVLCEKVAATESGKLKPASFTRRLEKMAPRMRQARRAANNAQDFFQDLEPALVLVRPLIEAHQVLTEALIAAEAAAAPAPQG